MNHGVGQILSHAVGVAISPVAVIAVVLILAAPRGRANALAFALGWILAVSGALALLVLLGDEAGAHRDGHTAGWVPWFRVVLGILLLLLAFRQLRLHNTLETGSYPLPERLRQLDEFTPGRCIALGVLLALSNPKNVTQLATGAINVAVDSPGATARVVTALVFIVIASLCVLVPLGVHVFGGKTANARLEHWREWTVRNHAAIMAVLFLLLGTKTLGDGISGLV